jgi:hypothetical protein
VTSWRGHRCRGRQREQNERGQRERVVRYPGQQQDADARRSADSVHQADPVRLQR